MPFEYTTDDVPEPRFVPPDKGTLIPKASLHVPGVVEAYLNHPMEEAPLGLAEPLSVVIVCAMLEAELVATDGVLGNVVAESTFE